MLISTGLLVYLLSTVYIGATANSISKYANATERRPSLHVHDGSSPSSPGPTPPKTSPSQPTPPPAADDAFEPQSILHPPKTIFPLLQPFPTSSQPASSTSTPPPPPAPQKPLPHPHPTKIHLTDPSLTPFDTTTCLSQTHCLICLDPTTTLTCYKYNCQCQRGNPVSHYMPASIQSCHRSDLCLSCPRGSSPWIWGRMAVCLTQAVEGGEESVDQLDGEGD